MLLFWSRNSLNSLGAPFPSPWHFIWHFKGVAVVVLVTQLVTLCDPATPPSMGFSRQEYWSGLPFPSPGDLPNPGIKTRSPALQADSLASELQGRCNRGEFTAKQLLRCVEGSVVYGVAQSQTRLKWLSSSSSRGVSSTLELRHLRGASMLHVCTWEFLFPS